MEAFTDLSTYFPLLKEFEHRALFDGVALPWEVLPRIGAYLRQRLEQERARTPSAAPSGIKLMRRSVGGVEETVLHITAVVEVRETIIVEGTDVLLGSGVVLEPGAMIKGAALIGEATEVRQGAYMRGDVIVGEHCTVGHATEVKNSVFMNHTEAGHFAYIGDSVLGSYVNIGAGVKLANLQLRKAADKLQGRLPPIRLRIGEEKFDTGISKIGAFIGDHAELGCNSVTAPAALIGAHSWVFANATVMKGFYPPRSVLR